MPDREKIINAIDICLGHGNCKDCGYNLKGGYSTMDCRKPMMRDVLALLKGTITPYIDVDEAKCPDCKVKLTRQELLGDDVLFEDFFDYCPHCGKLVKWG